MSCKNLFFWLVCFLVATQFIFLVSAQEEGEISLRGFELEKLIVLFNALISTFLFVVTFVAYKRDGRRRLFYVSLAFLLFAVKSYLISLELVGLEIEWIDPLAVFLELGVLISFFYGVMKK